LFFRPVFNFGNDNQFSKLLLEEHKLKLIESLSSEILELAEKSEDLNKSVQL
jgi:hypothetical protein